MSDPMLSVGSDQREVALEHPGQRILEWTITVPAATAARAPLNLALILDRSGSMSGDKLRYVQQAATYLIDQLASTDQLAVVAYDDQITVLSGSTALGEAQRRDLKARINALQPGGWTNLSGGWLQGCHEIASAQRPEGITRALLLTDGLANQGITDIEALIDHARQLRRRGITTSTFGVGLDFNEQLLGALAEQGGGHFFYIERPQQIPEVFRQELGELLTIVAREAFVTVETPAGVRLELLGDLPHEQTGTKLRVLLGDLGGGETRRIYTRALLPAGTLGTQLAIRGELGYAPLSGGTATASAVSTLLYAADGDVQRQPADAALLARASEVELAAATARALKLERAGQRSAAQTLMNQTLAAQAPHMPAPAAAAYQNLTDQMGQGLSEELRKSNHFAAYKKRNSRD